MTETKHGIDASFNDRLNILRAGVLGANDGIISIAGVVIGVASATSNLWIIFLSGLSAILAGAFSMAESKPFWTGIQRLPATPSMQLISKMGNAKRLLKS